MKQTEPGKACFHVAALVVALLASVPMTTACRSVRPPGKPAHESRGRTVPTSVMPPTRAAAETNIVDIPLVVTAKDSPRLRPGLTIRVIVTASGRKEVEEGSKRISESGMIVLPLIGMVRVDGYTPEELAVVLQTRYSEFLQKPLVAVDYVVDGEGALSPWGFVTVLGRVKEPGRVNIPPTRDLTLSMAVQLAGGPDSSAKLTGIRITRTVKGKAQHFDVDLYSVGARGKTEGDIRLQAGDIVYIPERIF